MICIQKLNYSDVSMQMLDANHTCSVVLTEIFSTVSLTNHLQTQEEYKSDVMQLTWPALFMLTFDQIASLCSCHQLIRTCSCWYSIDAFIRPAAAHSLCSKSCLVFSKKLRHAGKAWVENVMSLPVSVCPTPYCQTSNPSMRLFVRACFPFFSVVPLLILLSPVCLSVPLSLCMFVIGTELPWFIGCKDLCIF